jgi:prepilin-type N-terminal cleavage/methylation domain-containing protein
MAWKQGERSGDAGIFRTPGAAPRAVVQRAYTLTELLVVIILVGLAATVAMPSLAPGEGRKLDLVASEMANAIRFARDEAMRLGIPMGYRQQSSTRRIRVFSMDTGTTPATIVYDVYHPIDKQIYDRNFEQQPFAFTGGVSQTSTYRGTCNNPGSVFFDAGGIPWCADPDDVLLDRFNVTLTLGSSSRVITLHGITGRVTIQ